MGGTREAVQENGGTEGWQSPEGDPGGFQVIESSLHFFSPCSFPSWVPPSQTQCLSTDTVSSVLSQAWVGHPVAEAILLGLPGLSEGPQHKHTP